MCVEPVPIGLGAAKGSSMTKSRRRVKIADSGGMKANERVVSRKALKCEFLEM